MMCVPIVKDTGSRHIFPGFFWVIQLLVLGLIIIRTNCSSYRFSDNDEIATIFQEIESENDHVSLVAFVVSVLDPGSHLV
jgi:hypothetical protein